MSYLIKRSIALLLCVIPDPASADACPIPGQLIQWQADYCLLVHQTDDLIVVQPCIHQEASGSFASECAAKRHYKRLMCQTVLATGARSGTLSACLRDPTFAGRVVAGDGI